MRIIIILAFMILLSSSVLAEIEFGAALTTIDSKDKRDSILIMVDSDEPIKSVTGTLTDPNGEKIDLTFTLMIGNIREGQWLSLHRPAVRGDWSAQFFAEDKNGLKAQTKEDYLTFEVGTAEGIKDDDLTEEEAKKEALKEYDIVLCGDGFCSERENPFSCWEDCKVTYDSVMECDKEEVHCSWDQDWFFPGMTFLLIIIGIIVIMYLKRIGKIR